MSSLSVPSGRFPVEAGLYDSSMVEREAQHRTRTDDPFLTIQGRGFADDLGAARKALLDAQERERVLELAQALASEGEQAEVPSRFPRRPRLLFGSSPLVQQARSQTKAGQQ